jgi:universal stress protein A
VGVAYKNILVAVDTSDESGLIITAAKDLMAQEGASISIVTVIVPLAGFYIDMYSMLGDLSGIESQAVEQARASLSDLASRHEIQPASSEVIMGKPATEIHKFAESMGADLIVLGTHGQHGLGLMLGSTANAVLHGASCDVLSVRVGAQ